MGKRLAALAAALLLSLPAAAEGVHGLSLYGPPKYPASFKHFDYVNPDAPKGGEVRQTVLGGFDSLNPFIIRGEPAAGAGLVFQSLTEGDNDEPFSEYGSLAESIELAPDRSWVAFTFAIRAGRITGSITPMFRKWNELASAA